MKTLYIKSFRNLKEIRGKAFLITLIIGAGISIYGGGFMSRDTILHTRDTYYNDLNLADLEMEFTPVDQSELPELNDLENDALITARLVMPGTMEIRDDELLQALVIYIDPASMPDINRLKLIDGEFLSPDESYGVVIERTLAEVHGYKTGDKIILNPYTFSQELTVKGIGISPEFIISSSDPTVLIPSKGSLGVIFASMKLVEDIFGYPLYNQLLFKLKGSFPVESFKQKVKEKSKSLDIIRIVSREEQFSYRFLKEDMKGFSVFIPSIVFVFAVIIALILIITTNRLVLSQSREIGVLMVLGYHRNSIFFSYLFTAIVLFFAGCLIAIPGSVVIRDLFSKNYAEIIGLPPLKPRFTFSYILEGAIIFLFVTVVATAIPLFRALKMLPQELLKGEGEERFIHIPEWFQKYTTALKLGSSMWVFGLRNIFRRPKLATATIIVIACAIALSTSFLISASSWEEFARVSFSREKWDAIVAFKTHLEESDLKIIMATKGIKKYEPLAGGYGAVKIGEKEYDYMLVGVDPKSQIRHFNIEKGTPLSDENRYEILINKAWADLPEINPGEFVKVITSKGAYDFRVVGIIADMTLGTVYVPINVARSILGLENKTSAVLAVFESEDHENIRNALFNHEMVSRVELKRNMESLVGSYMEQMKKLSYVALTVSVIIGILFMLSSITTNIHERTPEYATLQTLGYYNRELAKTIIAEILGEGLIAMLLSIPLTILLSKYLNIKMSEAWLQIDINLNIENFLSVIILSLLFLPLAGLPGLIQIFKQDLSIAVRRRSFG